MQEQECKHRFGRIKYWSSHILCQKCHKLYPIVKKEFGKSYIDTTKEGKQWKKNSIE